MLIYFWNKFMCLNNDIGLHWNNEMASKHRRHQVRLHIQSTTAFLKILVQNVVSTDPCSRPISLLNSIFYVFTVKNRINIHVLLNVSEKGNNSLG